MPFNQASGAYGNSGGWMSAIGDAMSQFGDRYTALRQMKFEDQLKLKQQQMAEESHRAQLENARLQQENLNLGILGKKQEMFDDTYGPGDELTPDAAEEAKQIGRGGRVLYRPTMTLGQGGQMALPGQGFDLQGQPTEAPLLQQAMLPQYSEQDRPMFRGTRGQLDADEARRSALALQQAQLAASQASTQHNTVQTSELQRQAKEAGEQAMREAKLREWMTQNPKATAQEVVRQATILNVPLPEAQKVYMDYQTRMVAAQASANNAGVRASSAERIAAANNNRAMTVALINQGNANARQMMRAYEQIAQNMSPEEQMNYWANVNMSSLFSSTMPSNPMSSGLDIQVPTQGGGQPPPQQMPQIAPQRQPFAQRRPDGSDPGYFINGQPGPALNAVVGLIQRYGTMDMGLIKKQMNADPSVNQLMRNMYTGYLDDLARNPQMLAFITEQIRQSGR